MPGACCARGRWRSSAGNIRPLILTLAVTAPASHHWCQLFLASRVVIMPGTSSWQLRDGEQIIACNGKPVGPQALPDRNHQRSQ